MKHLTIILVYGVIYALFGWWTDHTEPGRRLKHFLQTWKADGWVHGIMCSISVFLLFSCGILALAWTLEVLVNG